MEGGLSNGQAPPRGPAGREQVMSVTAKLRKIRVSVSSGEGDSINQPLH